MKTGQETDFMTQIRIVADIVGEKSYFIDMSHKPT